jgi:polygalacturonase
MKILLSTLLTAGALIGAPAVFDVRQFGAVGDGKSKDTAAIARAIDACAKAGGGTVQFPAGRYLTGTITLKSNITLQVETGATILGSQDPKDYPLRDSPWADGRKEISSLIYGADLENIAIRGGGTIDGQGEIWWKRQWFASPKKGRPEAKTPADFEEAQKIANGRPHLIKIVRSKYVTLDGLRLTNSPSWTVHPIFCEFVTVRGVSIYNPVPSPNTDGINPESCRNVHISDCTIDVGDDCITLKSGKDELGRKTGRPNENITITNCTMLKGHGGVVIGSEMSGGVRNVSITNCVFQGTDKGLRIKSQRGRGGIVEGVVMSNVVMQDVPEAFTITMFYAGADKPEEIYPVNEGTPRFRNILINNITARGSKSAGQITGLREMAISSILFSNVRIQAQKGFTCQHAKDIEFDNVAIDAAEGAALIGRSVEGIKLDRFRGTTDLK